MTEAKAYFELTAAKSLDLENNLKSFLEQFSENETLIGEIRVYLCSKYSEKHRAYHNLSHLEALFSQAETYRRKFADFDGVKFAIWFHDVLYNPKRFDNESESAKIAGEFLTALNLPTEKVEKVKAMISATAKHAATGLDFDGKLFLDLDLTILGQRAEIYRRYSKAIRREYSFVPWFLYKRSRRKILENFLRRETIYFTDEIRRDFEVTARVNLANEINELS
jgi:predicted metal-dependent HD superfamily phosphohydrolase